MNHWERIAYLARYANQPIDALLAMRQEDFQLLYWATVKIVRQENGKGKAESDIIME